MNRETVQLASESLRYIGATLARIMARPGMQEWYDALVRSSCPSVYRYNHLPKKVQHRIARAMERETGLPMWIHSLATREAWLKKRGL